MALIDEVKAALEKKSLVIGKSLVLKRLKQGRLARVVTAANCNPLLKKELKALCEVAGIKYQEVKLSNMDLGAMCKRSHSVSVMGFNA